MGANGVRALQLLRRDFTHYFARHSHDHRTRRNAPAFGYQSTRGNQAFLADLAARKRPGANADQRVAANAAPVQHGGVSDHHSFLHVHGQVVIRMHHAAVLNIDARPQRNPGQVPAHHRGKPDVDPGRQHHVSQHDRPGGDIRERPPPSSFLSISSAARAPAGARNCSPTPSARCSTITSGSGNGRERGPTPGMSASRKWTSRTSALISNGETPARAPCAGVYSATSSSSGSPETTLGRSPCTRSWAGSRMILLSSSLTLIWTSTTCPIARRSYRTATSCCTPKGCCRRSSTWGAGSCCCSPNTWRGSTNVSFLQPRSRSPLTVSSATCVRPAKPRNAYFSISIAMSSTRALLPPWPILCRSA